MNRLVNLAYSLLVEHADKDQREEIDDQLNEPPRGRDHRGRPSWARGDDDMAMDMDELRALTASFGTG